MSDLDIIPKIYIVGHSVIQNELIAQHIEASTGYPCAVCRDIDKISTDEIKHRKTLILLDHKDNNLNTVFTELKQKINCA